MRLAQRYLLDPMGRQRAEEKSSQTQPKPRQRSPAPGRVFRSRTSASLTQAQIRSRRQSQHRGRAQQPVVQGSSGDVTVADTAGCGKTDRAEQTFKRTSTGPVVKVTRHHSNHNVRVKSLRLLRNGKGPLTHVPPPSSNRASTLPALSTFPSSSPPASSVSQSDEQRKQQNTSRMAFIK
ncbi:hypothetical protein INR49_019771 [Caranx melampygus]|nr:hypothetical protein INR49_019771 [Caranx melampygus]